MKLHCTSVRPSHHSENLTLQYPVKKNQASLNIPNHPQEKKSPLVMAILAKKPQGSPHPTESKHRAPRRGPSHVSTNHSRQSRYILGLFSLCGLQLRRLEAARRPVQSLCYPAERPDLYLRFYKYAMRPRIVIVCGAEILISGICVASSADIAA